MDKSNIQVLNLYETGDISFGKAAELTGFCEDDLALTPVKSGFLAQRHRTLNLRVEASNPSRLISYLAEYETIFD